MLLVFHLPCPCTMTCQARTCIKLTLITGRWLCSVRPEPALAILCVPIAIARSSTNAEGSARPRACYSGANIYKQRLAV